MIGDFVGVAQWGRRKRMVKMEYPIRKQIRLKNYDYNQNNAYFITICTHHQIHLFGKIINNTVGAAPCGRPNTPAKSKTDDHLESSISENLNDAGKMIENGYLN